VVAQAHLDYPYEYVLFLCASRAEDIRATDDVDRWLSRVSSAELVSHGVARVLDEQEKLMSHRVAACLKMRDVLARQKVLRKTFDIRKDVDFEDRVLNFYQSMSIVVCFGDYPDLDERVDLLADSLNFLLEVIPCSTPGRPSPGTACGTALVTYPCGVKLVADARAHLEKAVLTQKKLEVFGEYSQEIKGAISEAGPIFDCAPADLLKVENATKKVFDEYAAISFSGLPEFFPDLNNNVRLATSIECWLGWISDGCVGLLSNVLVGSTTAETLSVWVGASESQLNRVFDVKAAFEACPDQLGKSSAQGQAVTKCFSICSWLVMANSVIVDPSDALEPAVALKKFKCLSRIFASYCLVVFPDGCDVGNLQTGISAFVSSPLLAANGDLHAACVKVLAPQAEKLLTPIAELLSGIFGSETYKTFSLAMASDKDIKNFENSELPPLKAALDWATSTGDSVLVEQLNFFFNMHQVAKAMAIAESIARFQKVASGDLAQRMITQDQVDATNDLQTRTSAFTKFVDANSAIFDSPSNVTTRDIFHEKRFDNYVDIAKLGDSMCIESERIMKVFSAAWVEDMTALAESIDELSLSFGCFFIPLIAVVLI
jgi:hypothetical protein